VVAERSPSVTTACGGTGRQSACSQGKRHNVTISRLYKDGDQWKDSTSFGRDDLPLVAKVVELAHTWIFEQNGHAE
jgi:hypothetical protein